METGYGVREELRMGHGLGLHDCKCNEVEIFTSYAHQKLCLRSVAMLEVHLFVCIFVSVIIYKCIPY